MKIHTIVFLLIIFSISVYAENYVGKVIQIKPGTYRISYPTQSINIYFHYNPINGIEHILVDSDLNEHEKNEVVWLLKAQIDQFPETIIAKYLDIDIFPLQIKNTYEFGWTVDNQVMVEVSRIKDEMSYKNSIKSSFTHQLAHLLEKDPTVSKAAASIKKVLNELHQTTPGLEKNINKSIFKQGFVSTYATGEVTGQYSADEEFAELFAYLTCEESREGVINFVREHPNDLLSIKINRFIDILSEQVPSLDKEYFFREEILANEITAIQNMDGELLLARHEYKSYESFDFSPLYTDVEVSDIDWENEFIDVSPVNAINEPVTFEESQTYRYSDQLHTFSNEQEQNPENQTMHVRKKHKGTGAIIIITTLLIVLSAL